MGFVRHLPPTVFQKLRICVVVLVCFVCVCLALVGLANYTVNMLEDVQNNITLSLIQYGTVDQILVL